MSERYYITGAQIGVIRLITDKVREMSATSLNVSDVKEIEKIMKEIEDKQFVGNIEQEGEYVAIIG